jgi:exopolyphosphatase/pppGpp-phosphohydrolase
MSPPEILKNYGSVVEGREDIIFAGTIILTDICRTFGINEVLVSSKGIRYGAIISYLKKEYQNGK